MRFYNLITESTQDDLDRILMKMSMPEIEYIEKLYKNSKSLLELGFKVNVGNVVVSSRIPQFDWGFSNIY